MEKCIAKLLSSGFDSNFADRIGQKGYTLTQLKQSSKRDLLTDFSVEEVDQILLLVKRRPIPTDIVQRLIEESDWKCCMCRKFDIEQPVIIHHIQEHSKTHNDDYENLVVLCLNHHAAAHTKCDIARDPLPAELLRLRKKEWTTEVQQFKEQTRLSISNLERSRRTIDDFVPSNAIGKEFEIFEKEIGTPWSNLANQPSESEIVRFEGKLLATATVTSAHSSTLYELYLLRDGYYLVYSSTNHHFDYGTAHLAGVNAWDEHDPPLTLERVQNEYPALAKRAGLVKVRDFSIA